MLSTEFNTAKLIAHFLAGNITEEESAALEAWKNASPENLQLFVKLIHQENQILLQEMASHYDTQEAWINLKIQLIPELKGKRNVIFSKWYYYAAAAILIPLIVTFFFWKSPVQHDNLIAVAKDTTNVITPGSSKATLTLADGSKVDLDAAKAFELKEKGGVTINKDSSVLNYKTTTGVAEPVFNQLDIPRGGEYSLVLSDGSKVYLNAMTKLRFPVSFVGNERRVELQGEAYFEVVHSDKPFIVQTKDAAIEVMGTSFNVSSYTGELVQTTLVTGKVKVELRDSKETVYLAPSQQATFDRETGRISVEKVDVSPYIAWKNGMFYFKDWRLEDIMTYLSRWYDIDVVYKDKNIGNYKFGCKFNRYDKITTVLELLEKTDKVKAKIDGKTIVFRDKNER